MTDNASRQRQTDGYEPRFDLDLDYGAQGQLIVVDHVEALKAGQVEVKRDARWHETRRFFVEYQCLRSGEWRSSGIATTTATLWAFVLGDTEVALYVPTALLKDICRRLRHEQHGFFDRTMLRGSHPTRGVLLPLDRLLTELARYQQRINRGESL